MAVTSPSISVIVAHTSRWGIGKEGKLPWKSLPEDMKRFKNITIGKSPQENKNVCIMGRKTWESIPERFRPLKDRINVVISTTTSTGDYPDEVRISRSLQEALERLKEEKDNHGEIFVIGGASLIKEAMNLPECRTMYTTRVGIDPWECDVIIDKINEHVWEPISVSKTFSHDGIPYDFVDYRRKENGKVCETLLAECRPKSRFQHDEYEYLRLIEDIIENGEESDNRTGVGTRTIFSCHMRFSLRDGVFPLLTTKRVFWRGVLEELLWFIKGDTNAKHLSDRGVKIWDLNGTREFLDGRGLSHREEGDLGPVYGFQWRHFGAEYVDMHTDYSDGVDQLAQVIKQLKENPTDRRIIMSAWNPQALPLMALPPCHVMCHFYVNAKRELSCAMYQRSADMGLGVPFNIASYSLLTYMLAQVCDLKPGEFCHHLGNTHVYENHIEPLREQLKRTPKPFPLLKINPDIKCIDDFKASDFELVGYNPWASVSFCVELLKIHGVDRNHKDSIRILDVAYLSNDSPLASVGIDDDMYDREVGVDIKDAALAVIKGEKNIKRVCNPLSKASENPWNQEHKKTDIMNEIWLDVSSKVVAVKNGCKGGALLGTNYSNREWFGKEENQRRMQRILYVWCKERNKEYRQGMSDIATVLLYGIIGDESGNNITSDGAADGEADAYILFDAIMSGHISHSDMFYSDAAPGYHNNISPLAPSAAAPPKSRILERCEHIFNVLLPKADRDLSDHLHNSAKVAPSLFLMRWVRLLFAREMHVVEVLRLWDMLFADSYLHWVSTNEVALPLVDFMAVSMILQVKSTLMVGDNTACLQRLMRYPPVEHVEPLVGVALRLRDGDKALRPRIVSDNVDDARVAEDESIVEEQSASPVSEHLDQQQTSEPRYSQATTQQTNSSMRQLPIDPLRAEHPGSLSALFGSVVHSAVDAFSTALAEGRPTPQSYDGKPQGVSNTRLEGQGTASPVNTVTPPDQIRMPGDLTDSWEEGDFGDNSPQKDEDSHRPCEVTDTELERWQRALDDTIAVISGAALSSDTTLADSAIDRLRDISASIGEARRRRQDLPPTVD